MPSSPGSSRSEQRSPATHDGPPEAPPTEAPRPERSDAAEQTPDGRAADTAREGELRAELARLDDRYRRALADLDNYRKRSAREFDQRVQEARDTLLREWLEALDSVERALRMDAGTPLAEGMRAVLEQMEAILARHGVHRIGSAGERFDPERHEAIGVRATDEAPDQTVLEVARSGFAAGDRVLRPAQVIVSRRPAPEG
jgi:molecular chaperone GrpE